jgi:carbonic anhydrase
LKIADFGLFDDITTAGGSLGVLNEDYWPGTRAQIDVAIKHKVKAIFVVDHHDCLAFKVLGPFSNEAEARECHLAKLREAKERIEQYLGEQGTSQIEVLAFYWNERELEPVE